MFYSHQLLARKAPLGQIWMAATMHAKLNRRKLDKLNLIHICEEILNPSVPMALRLSGILMGGVVIVYERKVKLLYDDVTRLLVEINEAWKVKAARDPRDRTLLPKSKTQAKKEAVTLPEAREEDVGGIEQSLNDLYNANATAGFGFHQSAYFAMQLDDVDGSYFNIDHQEEIVGEHSHQAHPENITLDERFDSCQVNTDAYNHFERFDIEGDEGTQPSFTYGEYVEIPTTVVTSPPLEEVQRAEEIPDHHGCKEARQDEQRQGPVKRKPRKQAGMAMDYEQTVIPGNIYQSWLQDANDIVSRRGTKKKASRDIISTMKVANLMELPPIIFIGDSSSYGNQSIYYPKALMELWMKSTQPAHDSPSARTSPPLPPEPSISSPQRYQYQEAMGFNFEDFHGGGEASESLGVSVENIRTNVGKDEIRMDILMLSANPRNNGLNITGATFSTPANDVVEATTIPSSVSGHGSSPLQAEVNPGRSSKKRLYSSSRHSGSSLETVAEEPPRQFSETKFKLLRLSENGPTADHELLVETGPTQTQQPIICEPDEKMTDSIRMQMKSHFEAPGAPQVESLDALAAGMNRKGAAMLFYQTCVLATRGFLRVKQDLPYGEILISKGGKL